MRADVYFNLRKNLFSIRHKGRVIEHTPKLFMRDVKFVVQPAGLARAKATGVRNVHAVVRGEVLGRDLHHWCHRLVRYNCFKQECFYYDDNGECIYEADRAFLRLSSAGMPQVMVGG